MLPDILGKENCSILIFRKSLFRSKSQNVLSGMFLIHVEWDKSLDDQLKIGNITTLLPIKDGVEDGETHRGKRFMVKEVAVSAFTVATITFLDIIKEVIEEGGYS